MNNKININDNMRVPLKYRKVACQTLVENSNEKSHKNQVL
jgi:hypothetical protein